MAAIKTYLYQTTKRVGVGSGDYLYSDSIENYVADGGPNLPPLPSGMTERLYEPGVRHALIRDGDVVDGGPMPFFDGDAIIGSAAGLVSARRSREEEEARAKLEAAKAAMKS